MNDSSPDGRRFEPLDAVTEAQSLAEDDLAQQHPVLQRLQNGQTNLGHGARVGAMWAVGSRIGNQILQFLSMIVLARVLTPADYGVAAVVLPIVTFANIFTNLGLGISIIHARRVTEKLLSTAFWLNLVSGFALTGIVIALAAPLSSLYGIPQLLPLILVASLSFSVNVSLVHTALLERTLRFKQIAVIETSCSLLSILVTILAAVLGAGPYSLVLGGPLTNEVALSVATWTVVRWLPRALPDMSTVRALWKLSRGIVGWATLDFWSRNADNLLLGRFVSLADLGNYSRAYSLMRLPVVQMNAMMTRALLPALTRLRDDRQRLGRAWLTALATAGAVTGPVGIGTAVAAPALVEVLFGRRWLGMVTVLELLAVSALPQTLATTAGGFLGAIGATDTLFKLGLVTTAMSLTAIVAGLRWGTVGVAAALAIKFYLEVFVSLRPCLRRSGLRWRDLVRRMSGIWTACLALAAAGLAVRIGGYGHLVPWQMLLAQIGAASAAYVGVLALLDRAALKHLVGLFGALGRSGARA